MDYDNGFILQKTVDWSLLNDGMTIPVSVCSLFKAWDESILTHGQSVSIRRNAYCSGERSSLLLQKIEIL